MRSKFMRHLGALAAGALVIGLSAPASAQDASTLREQWMLPIPPNLPIMSTAGRVSPGSSAGSPTAFGPNWGDGFVGGGFQARTRYMPSGRDGMDGTMVAGFGLGNSRDLVGLEVAATAISTFDSGLGDKISFSFKAHRVLPGNVGVAVGWENAAVVGPGAEDADGGNSLYGVASKVFQFGDRTTISALVVSAGVGNGRFRFEEDVREDKETVNAFGSVGLQVMEGVGVIADWTGQDLTLAASLVPFESIPLIITPGIADVTGTAGDGARFTLGAGIGFDFADLPPLLP